MRGALKPIGSDVYLKRIIPADAGSTPPAWSGSAGRQDHPRGCGEHQSSRNQCQYQLGSSPRMRGAPMHYIPLDKPSGIIPADAGSTQPVDRELDIIRDHPRGCGEHGAPPYSVAPWPGSSPRMRGAPTTAPSPMRSCRIIPADAGSTWAACPSRRPWGDHPRGCGEHRVCPVVSYSAPGSSPRMRGARGMSTISITRTGIIPADAGSTNGALGSQLQEQDHPRGCGEHAGRRTPPPWKPWDHPRGCGEHVTAFARDICHQGSSPRMRGAPAPKRGI